MDRARFAAFAVVTLLAPLLTVSTAAHAPGPARGGPPPGPHVGEHSRPPFGLDGPPLRAKPRYRPHARFRRSAAATPPVGTVREWLGLDDTTGKYYRKSYTLRAVGRHIEVWVAQDLAFP